MVTVKRSIVEEERKKTANTQKKEAGVERAPTTDEDERRVTVLLGKLSVSEHHVVVEGTKKR